MSSKAIVMFGSTLLGGGGAERRFARVFRKLREKDESVFLVTNESLYQSMKTVGLLSSDQGVILYRGPVRPNIRDSIELSKWLIRTSREHEIGLLHLVLLQRVLVPYYLFLSLGGQRETAIVSTVASSLFGGDNVKLPLETRVGSRLVWSRADAIDSLYSRFTQKYSPIYGDKISTTPCSFTDYQVFRPSYPKRPWVVFSGRLIPEKNPELFVEAVAEVLSRREKLQEDWRFFLLGAGPLESKLRARIQKMDLEGVLTLRSTGNVAPYVRSSSLFLSLQAVENYPSQALLEAMACENCVVVTDVGETRRLVDETRGVLVSPSVSPQQLASIVLELMADVSTITKLAQNASAFVRENHTLERFSQYLTDLWSRTLSNKDDAVYRGV